MMPSCRGDHPLHRDTRDCQATAITAGPGQRCPETGAQLTVTHSLQSGGGAGAPRDHGNARGGRGPRQVPLVPDT